jgi:hypothetical protein
MTPLLSLLVPCLIVVTLCYLARCVASPWGECSHCHGNPRRYCRHCDSTGKRPRLAWRAAAYLIRAWRDSNR